MYLVLTSILLLLLVLVLGVLAEKNDRRRSEEYRDFLRSMMHQRVG